MNLQELRDQFWSDADDVAEPHLFEQADVDLWANEAQDEAALRADLLLEADLAEMCEITVAAGTAAYTLDTRWHRITYATFTPDGETEPRKLTIVDRVELDRLRPSWRTQSDVPEFLIVEPRKVRLAYSPSGAGTLKLEGYRAPLERMVVETDEPEVSVAHHAALVHWMLWRAYNKPDPEVRDPGRAQAALAEFTRIFGPRPDADLKRAGENRPAFNKAYV